MAVLILAAAAFYGIWLLLSFQTPQAAGGQSTPLAASAPKAAPSAPECSAGEARNCTLNGCPGTQKCYNGAYSSCVLPKKTCVPGRKIGCSSDSCKFGYMTCNECGTGYGECLPPENQTPSDTGCTGANCQ